MTSLFETMTAFFTDDEWPFVPDESSASLRAAFRGDNGEWTCYAQVKEEQSQFLFYSVVPLNVPGDRRPAMAEFLTRANYGLPLGNFEMDFADGEVRFKTSIDVEDDRLSEALIRNAVYMNLFTLDKYLPGIMAVMYGDVTPVQAIAEIEG